ncbi:MAG TPA: hypothetical protein VGB34_10395 [Candidatus Limnocylindria bacterium]
MARPPTPSDGFAPSFGARRARPDFSARPRTIGERRHLIMVGKMGLPIALLALLTIVGVAIGIPILMGPGYAWPILGLGGFAAIAAIVLVLRHRYAEAFLRMVAMSWAPLGLVFLLGYLIGPTDGGSRPDWAVPAVVLGLIGSVASVVAIYAGFAHLRRP